MRLGEISEYIQRGKSPKYGESSIPVISQKSVQWTGFDIHKSKHIDATSVDSYKEERFLRDQDILWNSTGDGTVGRAVLLRELDFKVSPLMVADSHVTVVRLPKSLSPFLFRYISSPVIQQNMGDMVSGSTKQVELNTTTIKQLPVPIPPLAEQSRILAKLCAFNPDA